MNRNVVLITLLCVSGILTAEVPHHTRFETSKKKKPLSTLAAVAGAAPSVDAQPALTKEQPKIYLNFNNASLDSVLDYLKRQLGLDVIPHKDLKNVKGSLISRSPMTYDEAWQALLVLLDANGYAIATVNGVTKVLPCLTNDV